MECDLYFRPSYRKQFGSKIRTWIFTVHHSVAQNSISDMWLSTFEISVGRLCSVTNIALKTPRATLTYLMTGGSEGFFWVWHKFLSKRDFFGSMKDVGIFWARENNREIFLGIVCFWSAQIKNNISAIYSFVFDQNQSWSWHVLAFQKINNKICWCKNTEGFFGVC